MNVLKKIIGTVISASLLSLAILIAVQTYNGDKSGIVPQTREYLKNTRLGSLLGLDSACRFPLAYSIGQIPPGFNISKSELESAVATASKLWEKAVGTKVFTETPDGPLKIGLIYDDRQKETQILARLGLTIEQNRTSFNTIESSYKKLIADHKLQGEIYDKKVTDFETAQAEVNALISYWNKRGGAPKSEYEAIQEKQTALKKTFAELEADRLRLNENVKNLNTIAAVLNQMAKEMNLKVDEYNSGGTAIRNVFDAGVYESDQAGRRIFIYQFEDKNKLISVLEHELGHALGLEHNDDKNSIMYRLNQGQIQNITKSDVLALQKLCPNLKK